MCLILMQIHLHIFNLVHPIRRKTNNLKREELRKNIFPCLFSVHNTISLHVMSILVHGVINLFYNIASRRLKFDREYPVIRKS